MGLSGSKSDSKESRQLSIGIPMIWTQPKNHVLHCYFCLTFGKVITNKSKHTTKDPQSCHLHSPQHCHKALNLLTGYLKTHLLTKSDLNDWVDDLHLLIIFYETIRKDWSATCLWDYISWTLIWITFPRFWVQSVIDKVRDFIKKCS